MTPAITFFDIASHLPNKFSSSPYCWRIRLALNYKSLAYTTEWATTDQIASVCKANGILPTGANPDGSPLYTFPAIIDSKNPNDVHRISNSRAIIEYLEKTYPEPALNPSDAKTAEIEQYIIKELMPQLGPLVFSHFVTVMPQRVVDHYENVAKTRWGTTLSAYNSILGPPGSPEREAQFEGIRKTLQGIGYEEGQGWLDGGEKPSYKDFIVFAALAPLYVNSRDECWARLVTWDGRRWKRFCEAIEPYTVIQ